MTSRLAVVTGTARGIGRAISERLADADYRVAAIYAGNHAATAECPRDGSIFCYQWDVADYEACTAGIANIEGERGPVIVVNNASFITDLALSINGGQHMY